MLTVIVLVNVLTLQPTNVICIVFLLGKKAPTTVP